MGRGRSIISIAITKEKTRNDWENFCKWMRYNPYPRELHFSDNVRCDMYTFGIDEIPVAGDLECSLQFRRKKKQHEFPTSSLMKKFFTPA